MSCCQTLPVVPVTGVVPGARTWRRYCLIPSMTQHQTITDQVNKYKSLLVVDFQFYCDRTSDYYRAGKQVKFISC